MIIYKIQNKINGLIYIGQSKKDLSQRIADHINHNKYYVQRALHRYGLESFDISVIDEADTKEITNEKEIYWIKFYNCKSPNGYNLTNGGDGNDAPRSVETRRRLSEAISGSKHYFYGKHHTDATKKKMSEALSGEKNPNYGKDLSGANNPTYGTKHSAEAILKMSKPRSEQGRANIKAAINVPGFQEKKTKTRKANAEKKRDNSK